MGCNDSKQKDPNGGNLKTTEVKRVTNGKYGELPIPTKKGYHLEGWNTKKDGSGKNITSDMKIKLSKDQKLFAQWIENEYQPQIDELDKQSYEKWIKNGKPFDGEQNTELMRLMREYSIKRAKIIYGKE